MPNNPFNIPDEMPQRLDMGNLQSSDFANQIAPSLDMLKMKVGQMRNKPKGGAGSILGGAVSQPEATPHGMKPESL